MYSIILFNFVFIFPIIKSGIVKIFDDNFEEKIKYESINYLYTYKISNSIMSYKANGDSTINQNLSFAFDNDYDIYWKSFKYQNDTF